MLGALPSDPGEEARVLLSSFLFKRERVNVSLERGEPCPLLSSSRERRRQPSTLPSSCRVRIKEHCTLPSSSR